MKLPPYYMDRYEVTNREYQDFVDRGGYEKPEYWPASFTAMGRSFRGARRWRNFGTRPAARDHRPGQAGIIPRARRIFPFPV